MAYCVVKGDPAGVGEVQFNREGKNPHYHVTLNTASGAYDVAFNTQSEDGSEVLYTVDQAFTPPSKDGLIALATGATTLPSQPGGLALDYVRETIGGQPMVNHNTMQLLPAGSRQNDLHNQVVDLLNRATADPNGTLYAFGDAYDDGTLGVHDMHMNQGNPTNGGHAQDNGIWQDGALFINLPEQDQWIAIFIAFQTQSWQTDNNGDPAAAQAQAR